MCSSGDALKKGLTNAKEISIGKVKLMEARVEVDALCTLLVQERNYNAKRYRQILSYVCRLAQPGN